MKRSVLLFLAVMFLSAFLADGIKAQREMPPSVPVAVQWLRDNNNQIVGIYPQGTEKKSIIKPGKIWEVNSQSSACSLSWKTKKSNDLWLFIMLRDMNPEKVTVSESDEAGNGGSGFWQVRMFATNATPKKKAVMWTVSKEVYYSNEIRLVLRDKSMAERFARALRDAFTACGGKPDSPEPY